MWADAANGAKASQIAAVTHILILFMIHLSLIGCLLLRVPAVRVLRIGTAILGPWFSRVRRTSR
jgi:hypothetical protein